MSSPITLSGFNNIDFKSIINLIMEAERQKITRVQAQQKIEQTRISDYHSLSANLTTLQSAFTALESASNFGDLTASVSDTTILTASATSSATKGAFTIDVQSLARPQVTISAERQFGDINAAIIDGGTFSITQHGTTTNLDLTGVESLTDLRDAINAQQSGVRAAIINDGSSADTPPKPFRLVLTSTQAGISGAFSFNDQTSFSGGSAGGVLNLSTDATNGSAKDAEFKYNGITIRSSSNTVGDAIPGLTLKLLKPGTATVTVTDDDSSLQTKIKAVVTAFNAFNDFASTQFKIPTDGTPRSALATDPLLRGINRQLRSYFISDVDASGDIHNLAELGIGLTQTGKLTLDEAALDSALTTHRTDVEAFFSGSSGFAAKISNLIDSYAGANGSIHTVETNTQRTIDSYTNKIQRLEAQLALREETLTKQFAAADRAISQLNSQVNALNGLGNQFRLF
ncbi:MAG: hypothetical protein DMG14_14385 [Acidobacteria bacterium]|nr:MAG: hypothetical protein DMG14_14385 [Acidobacteriota bacterium]